MIKITDLTKKFGDQTVLDNINLEISDNEKIILLGQNGAGKTTLIRCILGEYKPDSGTVLINSASPVTDRVKAISDIAFVPQLPPPLKLTVEELLEYAGGLSGFNNSVVLDFCEKMQLDIKPHMKKTFHKLSGGMKQKVLISIALARGCKKLIFDEPTANLDTAGREHFLSLVHQHCADTSIIFISHRLEDVADMVTRKIEMDMGRVISDETV